MDGSSIGHLISAELVLVQVVSIRSVSTRWYGIPILTIAITIMTLDTIVVSRFTNVMKPVHS